MRFVGNIETEGRGIRIDGHVIGDISCLGGIVVLSEYGIIEGNLSTAFVVINGAVKGNIIATSAVELQAHSQIYGDILAPVVEMHLGATVKGKVETTEDPGSEKFTELRTTARAIAEEARQIRIVK